MADLSDVSDGLAALLSGALYPSGVSGPTAVSAAGMIVKVYAGWPAEAGLDADLRVGIAHVSIFNRESRNTTRYQLQQTDLPVATPTLTLTINARTVTVGGTATAGVNTAIIVGTNAFTYQAVANDTPATIATALAALINATYPGTSASGAVITLPATGPAITAARVGSTGTQQVEAGRVEQVFQITVWANTPANRKAIASLLVPGIMSTRFLTLADSSSARLILKSQRDDDVPQKELLYRRDIMATVEYAETVTNTATQVIDIVENIAVGMNGYNGGTYPNTTTVNT